MARPSYGTLLVEEISGNIGWLYEQILAVPMVIATNPYQYLIATGFIDIMVWLGAFAVNFFIISIPIMLFGLFDYLFGIFHRIYNIIPCKLTFWILYLTEAALLIPLKLTFITLVLASLLAMWNIISYTLFGTMYSDFFEQLHVLYGVDERVTNVFNYKTYCVDAETGAGTCDL